MVVHLVARSSAGLLFHDWTEALALWRRLLAAFPEARAVCVMPNHTHVLAGEADARARMSAVMSGFARWRAHRRGGDGACWAPQPAPVPVKDGEHLRRTERYVLLNPCRGRLATDPLAWPLSTHRDLCGFGQLGRRVRDPARLHAYVSSDPKVSLVGTELPGLALGSAPLPAIEAAVSAVLRLEPAEVRARTEARRLAIRAAWMRENTDVGLLGAWMATSRRTVYRALSPTPTRARLDTDPQLGAVMRAVGDPRFDALAPRPRVDRTRWEGWRVG